MSVCDDCKHKASRGFFVEGHPAPYTGFECLVTGATYAHGYKYLPDCGKEGKPAEPPTSCPFSAILKALPTASEEQIEAATLCITGTDLGINAYDGTFAIVGGIPNRGGE